MRTLHQVNEFRREAGNALFTKEQAFQVIAKLIEAELSQGGEDMEVLRSALDRLDIRFLDSNATATDALLDSIGVARFTAEDVATAIDDLIFESQI